MKKLLKFNNFQTNGILKFRFMIMTKKMGKIYQFLFKMLNPDATNKYI